MTVAVLANEEMKKEILERNSLEDIDFVWCDTVKSLGMVDAEAYFDLQYRDDVERNASLGKIKDRPIFVGDVNNFSEKKYQFIRVNNWPGFLKREIIELALTSEHQAADVKVVFEKLGWTYKLVPDRTGFVSSRVIAMIINEAYYALGENVSTRDDIDIAMKLGTNYPHGPFEWAKRIGLQNIFSLLTEMARENPRYKPAPAMKEEYESVFKS